MEDGKRSNSLVILVTVISLLVISIVSVYLFFFNKKEEKEEVKGLPLYKYEVYNGEYKYFTSKIDASKIALVDALYYECEKENDCKYAPSFYAGGNLYGTKAIIKDGKKFILYDFDKKIPVTLTEDDEYESVDFISNGKYLMIKNNNKFYAYNIEDRALSGEILTDFLVTDDNNNPYVVWDYNIITVVNNKYGIASLTSTNSVYENEYDEIKCLNNYCLLTKDDVSNLYGYSKDDTEAILSDLSGVIYFDGSYIISANNKAVNVYNIKDGKQEEIIISTTYDKVISASIDKDKNISLVLSNNNSWISYDSTGKTTKLDKSNVKLYGDVFISTDSKNIITVKFEKEAFDYKVDDKGSMYDNVGNYIDKISMVKDNYKVPDKLSGELVKAEDALEFLNNIATSLKLNGREKNYLINRWLPVLIKNNKSIVNVEVSKENKVYDDINVLTNLDSFIYFKISIKKVDKDSSSTKISIPEIDRKDNNIVLMTGFSY